MPTRNTPAGAAAGGVERPDPPDGEAGAGAAAMLGAFELSPDGDDSANGGAGPGSLPPALGLAPGSDEDGGAGATGDVDGGAGAATGGTAVPGPAGAGRVELVGGPPVDRVAAAGPAASAGPVDGVAEASAPEGTDAETSPVEVVVGWGPAA